jgi:SAM-dependent methyltransferase
MITREDVRAAYRLILGRDPESEEVIMKHLREARSLDDLRRAFICSSEFQHTPWVRASLLSPERPLDWPPNTIEIEADEVELSAMMRHIEANWQQFGLSDPHWSVLTHDEFRLNQIPYTETSFYQSGKPDVDRLVRAAERCGISLAGFKRSFELGCGVGRMTVWLAELFERVLAADISPPHLSVARQALDRLKRTNVDLVYLNSFKALEAIPEFDLFLSFIVLQHNPPPLIARLLEIVLHKLQPGGVAYFQVPTYRLDYHFQVDEYLRAATRTEGIEIEMHAIPQHVVFKILQESGCRLLECRENVNDEYGTISNSIFAEKRSNSG